MRKKIGMPFLFLAISFLILGGCSSFPRNEVSTDEQDITITFYDTAKDFTPATFDTLSLNYYIHILDTNSNAKSEIRDSANLFNGIKSRFEAAGYIVDSVRIPTDSLDSADISGKTIINVSQGSSEFTMYYYSYYWGWYYPYYPSYVYTYTYTIGSIMVGMVEADSNNVRSEIWTGAVSGFEDKTISQTERINTGLDEFFLLPPFKAMN